MQHEERFWQHVISFNKKKVDLNWSNLKIFRRCKVNRWRLRKVVDDVLCRDEYIFLHELLKSFIKFHLFFLCWWKFSWSRNLELIRMLTIFSAKLNKENPLLFVCNEGSSLSRFFLWWKIHSLRWRRNSSVNSLSHSCCCSLLAILNNCDLLIKKMPLCRCRYRWKKGNEIRMSYIDLLTATSWHFHLFPVFFKFCRGNVEANKPSLVSKCISFLVRNSDPSFQLSFHRICTCLK